MSITAALILLAHATPACSPVVPVRPPAATDVVRSILNDEPQAFELPALTLVSADRPSVAPPAEPMSETDPPEADAATEQCQTMRLVIA